MSDNGQAAWTREQLRAVRIAEREMQIVNGTVFAALRDEWVRAWPEVAAYLPRLNGAVPNGLVTTGRGSYERTVEKLARFGAPVAVVQHTDGTAYEVAVAAYKNAGAGI